MPRTQVKDTYHHDSSRMFSTERRSKVRFPLQLRASYRTLERGNSSAGEGWVVNMSRGGVLLSSRHEIGVGAPVELSIEWPSLLHGRVPLRFVTVGKVVRCDTSSFAILLSRYQFRTAKKKVTSIDALGAQRR
jgi:PilZ domain